MRDLETVIYRRDDAVAVITINRPDAMNSFNAPLRADLLAAFQCAAADEPVRVVVLNGEGRSFSAGADLKDIESANPVSEILQQEYRPVLECMATLRQPIIGAVGGSAAGIGMTFALACDLLVMGDNAFLMSAFSNISLLPDGGLNWFLVRQLGYRRAYQLAIEAERIDAARCVELGLANRAVPAARLMDETLAWAHSLARRAPLSLAATKKAMRHALAHDWSSTFDVEALLQQELRVSGDCAEGVRAFFEKRKPDFKGR
jgi:2-(1,2-epoxy-1,2-dihydrophenyl)acetyl-CoA isomerase